VGLFFKDKLGTEKPNIDKCIECKRDLVRNFFYENKVLIVGLTAEWGNQSLLSGYSSF
tara:strand:+ start:2856 stop:3029 length:174 start_codon:yes stop_codon:yes gene_type:complete